MNSAYLTAIGVHTWQLREPAAAIEITTVTDNSPWAALRSCVANCTACDLHQTRTQTVFGVGNQQAKLMLIGETPDFHEDQQGEPFIGRAGQLLNAMLRAVGFAREEVFITNILKCHPPENRDPLPGEVTNCTSFLNQQIKLLQPQLIVAIGKIAAHYLLQTKASLESLRGQQHQYGEAKTPLLVTYHPAYLLRNPIDKKKAYADWKQIKQKL